MLTKILLGISILLVLAAVRLLLQKKKIKNNQNPDKLFYFMMRTILRIRRKPKRMRKLLVELGVKERMFILDYGCGIGSYTMEAAYLIGSEGTIIAADIDKGMLKVLEKYIRKYNAQNVKPVLISTPDDVRECNFDCILFFDVIHLLLNKIETINKLLEKLKPEGMLIIRFHEIDKSNNEEIRSLLQQSNGSKTISVKDKLWIINK